VAPKQYALPRAADAFEADGRFASQAAGEPVRAVVEQVLSASQRLHGA